MRFVREQHSTPSGDLAVCYDRFTTRFSLSLDNHLVYQCWLGLWPFRRITLRLNSQTYQLSIRWLVLWRARLIGPEGVYINELLSARRRQSHIFAGYTLVLLVFRVGAGWWESL